MLLVQCHIKMGRSPSVSVHRKAFQIPTHASPGALMEREGSDVPIHSMMGREKRKRERRLIKIQKSGCHS